MIPTKFWTKSNTENFRRMVADGYMPSDFVRITGLSRNVFIGKAHRLGIKFDRKRISIHHPREHILDTSMVTVDRVPKKPKTKAV